jgi:hypothetical protein
MDKNRFKTLEAATEFEIRTLTSNALADLLARPALEEISDAPPTSQSEEALSRANFDFVNGRAPKGLN